MKHRTWIVGLFVTLALMAATTVTKISQYPQVTTPADTDLFLLASGSTNKNIKYSDVKSSINATNVNGSGTSNRLATWAGTNKLTSLANGTEGFVLGISNGIPTWVAVGGAGGTTNYFDITIISNAIFLSGKGNTLIITNNIQFPWNTLTMSGSNVSTLNLTNTLFKLTLTNDAFIGIPTGFPGTNVGHTIQIHVAQDGTGGRSLMMTNASWVLSGSGTSTNAVVPLTTNANAVTILTWVTSPFSSSKLYGVAAATGP